MIWFAALTGLRRGEMLALRSDQIRGDVLVLESTTKSGRPRGIPMPPRVARIAREHLPWGLPYWQLRKRFDAARAAIGMAHVHWHDLRHTYGSWLAQSGHPLTVIRDLMGHSSLAMTSRYSHLAPDHLRAAVASLPGWERAGKKSAGRTARKAA